MLLTLEYNTSKRCNGASLVFIDGENVSFPFSVSVKESFVP